MKLGDFDDKKLSGTRTAQDIGPKTRRGKRSDKMDVAVAGKQGITALQLSGTADFTAQAGTSEIGGLGRSWTAAGSRTECILPASCDLARGNCAMQMGVQDAKESTCQVSRRSEEHDMLKSWCVDGMPAATAKHYRDVEDLRSGGSARPCCEDEVRNRVRSALLRRSRASLDGGVGQQHSGIMDGSTSRDGGAQERDATDHCGIETTSSFMQRNAGVICCGCIGSDGCSSGGQVSSNARTPGKAQSFRGVTWDKVKQVRQPVCSPAVF